METPQESVVDLHAPMQQHTLSRRWIRPTGNCRPAFADRLVGFFLSPFLSPMVPLAPLPLWEEARCGQGNNGRVRTFGKRPRGATTDRTLQEATRVLPGAPQL